jgi:hypothetical protein
MEMQRFNNVEGSKLRDIKLASVSVLHELSFTTLVEYLTRDLDGKLEKERDS